MNLPLSSSTLAFAELVHAFCAWCEELFLDMKKEASLAALLARLYAEALTRPEGETENEEGLLDLPEVVLVKVGDSIAYFNDWVLSRILRTGSCT